MSFLSRMKSPLKRLGGKANLAPWIISNLPRHVSFVEAFGGSASVLLSKQRSQGQEIYNDLDGLWTKAFKCLRDQPEAVFNNLFFTPYGREEFITARDRLRAWREGNEKVDDLELTRLHFVVSRQSFSADNRSWSTSSFGGENRPKLWARLPSDIQRFTERLRGVYIEQRDYRDILNRYDHERACFYLDPPYAGVERKYYDANRDDGFDHAELRNAIEDLKGSVVVSYYNRPEIMDLYKGWRCERLDVTVHAGDVKRNETELLFIRSSDFGKKRRGFRYFDIFADS